MRIRNKMFQEVFIITIIMYSVDKGDEIRQITVIKQTTARDK